MAQKITSESINEKDYFGSLVSISNNVAIICSGAARGNRGYKAAYIYECDSSGNWKMVKKIDKDPEIFSISISSEYAFVGIIGKNYTASGSGGSTYHFNKGAVDIYKRYSDGKWALIQNIEAIDSIEVLAFGTAISCSEKNLIVGAVWTSTGPRVGDVWKKNSHGAAYIFELENNGLWKQVKKLYPDPLCQFGTDDFCFGAQKFGQTVGIYGNHAIVGAQMEYHNQIGKTQVLSGAVYIYEKKKDDVWNQSQKIFSENKHLIYFGKSVSISDNYAVVSCIPNTTNYKNVENAKTFYIYYNGSSTVNHLKENATTKSEKITDTLVKPFVRPEIGTKIILKNIFFEFDKEELDSESFKELDMLVNLMNGNPIMQIKILSHTDNVGNPDYNKTLSEKRANSVVQYLINRGIEANRLSAIGCGESQPIAPNNHNDGKDNPEGRKMNRRTEFEILKN